MYMDMEYGYIPFFLINFTGNYLPKTLNDSSTNLDKLYCINLKVLSMNLIFTPLFTVFFTDGILFTGY